MSNLKSAIECRQTAGDGPFGRRAEALLNKLHSGATSLLTTSCSHALELSARLLNLKPGDEVIVPSYTFVTTASAFASVGATPIFADIKDDTLNINPAHVEALISERTKAICIVHYGGVGADPHLFANLAERYGIALVEDNAHGLGGKFAGKALGTFGDMSTLSFHETKNITCGEGGAILVNQPNFVERARVLRDKGTDRKAFLDGQVDKYTWVDIGSSWVLSDLLAALLVGQLERFSSIQARRMTLWSTYRQALSSWGAEQGLRLQHVPSEAQHTAHMFYLRFSDVNARNRFIAHLKRRNVSAVFHYQALHESPFGRLIDPNSECPIASSASQTLVRLPLYAAMTDTQQAQVIDAAYSFTV